MLPGVRPLSLFGRAGFAPAPVRKDPCRVRTGACGRLRPPGAIRKIACVPDRSPENKWEIGWILHNFSYFCINWEKANLNAEVV